MKVRGITLAILRHWPLGALSLAFALALGVVVYNNPVEASQSGATAITSIHYGPGALVPEHTVLPCFAGSPPCAGQVGPQGSKVHDLATITSDDPLVDPTGTVTFTWRAGIATCPDEGAPTFLEDVDVTIVAPGVGQAESTNFGPLPAGLYSFKAVYNPDKTAKDSGLFSTPADCEQLRIIKSTVKTVIHFSPTHSPVPCFAAGCVGQVAPNGSTVHDWVGVNSGFTNRTPTGIVQIKFYSGDARSLHCSGPSSLETKTLSGANASTTAESSDAGPLAPGDYSYRATYIPDAAAIAKGLGRTPGPCEQLRVTP